MAILLTYRPNIGVFLNNVALGWGDEREKTRTALNSAFKISDNVMDLGQMLEGDSSHDIVQRRDIYTDYGGQENYFFLNFDNKDKLRDIEIHNGLEINIENTRIGFEMDIDEVVDLLSKVSQEKTEITDGEYLFNDLKLTVSSAESFGGEGTELACIYFSKDISHLI